MRALIPPSFSRVIERIMLENAWKALSIGTSLVV